MVLTSAIASGARGMCSRNTSSSVMYLFMYLCHNCSENVGIIFLCCALLRTHPLMENHTLLTSPAHLATPTHLASHTHLPCPSLLASPLHPASPHYPARLKKPANPPPSPELPARMNFPHRSPALPAKTCLYHSRALPVGVAWKLRPLQNPTPLLLLGRRNSSD